MSAATCPPSSLRLWPAVWILALQWGLRFVLPAFVPDAMPMSVLAGLLGVLALIVWWGFFSRASRSERLWGVLLLLAGLTLTRFVSHASIATGMMGLLIPIYAAPLVTLGFVAWAFFFRGRAAGPRPVSMLVAILLPCAAFSLLRTDGIRGGGGSDFDWRWSPTAEEQLLSSEGEPAPPPSPARDEVSVSRASGASAVAPPWPGFRGPRRDGVVRGVRVRTDWSVAPPEPLWRRDVGPGWSSFAVDGTRCFTQEQRGEEEVVACYDLETGAPRWMHREATRFWESNAGAGPRATPALADGRLFALGATGRLVALDPATGELLWSRDAVADTGAAVPEWGISGSPLPLGERVLVGVNGVLASFDAATGEPQWIGPRDLESYSSPHRATIDGVEQVLWMTELGLTSFQPTDGAVLWEYAFPGSSIVQPALIDGADGELLVSTSATAGTRRIAVRRDESGGFGVEMRWTSKRLKPYFNDFVVHGEHAFGLDAGRLTCVDLEAGKRQWKEGRYGAGQLILLAGQDVLLVVGEEGELALVAADPTGYHELARHSALEGKTWNHPVLAGDVLLVRNDQEMAAFRLALVDG